MVEISYMFYNLQINICQDIHTLRFKRQRNQKSQIFTIINTMVVFPIIENYAKEKTKTALAGLAQEIECWLAG